jgi:P4 family phage/plasmid primase-like protien
MFHSDPYEVFRSNGMTPPDEISFDGEIHRFSANGKPRDKAGWYSASQDGDLKVLYCGDWRMNSRHSWSTLESNCDKRTKEYKQAQKIREELRIKVQQQQQESHEAAARLASKTWNESIPAPSDHPYLVTKNIGPHGVRLMEKKQQLVIPLMNIQTTIQTLQFINQKGDKLFLSNGKMSGGFYWIGPNPDEQAPRAVLFCEGFATGATLHECTGLPVVVAFTVNNLKPVLQAILPRLEKKQTQVLLCADDDRFKDSNAGRQQAEALAQEYGIHWLLPQWPEGSETGTDFNDLSFQISKEELQQQVEAVLNQPAEIPASWWKSNDKGSLSFSSQFAAECWVQSYAHRIYQPPDLWQFNDKVWQRIQEEQAKSEIRRMICRGSGAEEGLLKASHVEDTLAQAKMILQQEQPIHFDSNKVRLVFRNGTFDWDSGVFLEQQFYPEDYTTILRDYDFDIEAQCPRWQSFLREVELEEDTIARLQEWCGYCLIPETNLQKCLMLVGDGKNGKSVFLQTLREVIGSANVSSLELAEMFDRFKVGTLMGKLANICSDVDTNCAIHTSFKKIVAGEHTVAERKHHDPFEFQPFARILFSANRFTPTRDHSEGFYRRFDIVRFERHFADHERDPGLLHKLRQELAGIFNWSLVGLVRLIQQDWTLTDSKAMSKEHNRFRLETHPFRGFVEECCELGSGEVEKNHFLESYKDWCEMNGYRVQSTHRVTADLDQMGVELVRARRASLVYLYKGVALL